MAAVFGNAQSEEAPLPPLREELSIHPGPRASDGSPSWVLEDPLTQRYYRLGWLEFAVLSRWKLGSLSAISAALCEQTTLCFRAEELGSVVDFLVANSLLQVRGEAALSQLRQRFERVRGQPLGWLLKNYLFLRMPLVKPSRFLSSTLPWIRWIFSPAFAWLTLCCGLLGVYLVAQQWDAFLATFPYFFTLPGVLAMGLALVIAKSVHELGHAYTATRYGCDVPTIGLALLVLWPVLYTETSSTWVLQSRRQRLAVGAAGMLAELTLAAYALMAWSLLTDGPIRSAVFLLATTTWILTLLVNLNPLMRFDGYFLLSDLLEIPNLQSRGFAYGRWQLREWLFGFGDPPPEFFSTRTKRLVLAYAYATWIYRFFLFLAIALLVYHFFFKVLGIALMVVELVWFIGRPVFNEVVSWIQRGASVSYSRRGRVTLLIAIMLLAVFFLPWQGSISAPALWQSGEYVRVYAKVAARVDAVSVQEGERVSAGQVLFELASPDLDFQIDDGRRELETLDWIIQQRGMNAELLDRSRVAMAEYAAEYAAQQSRLAEHAMLRVTSPQAGVVRDLATEVKSGSWVGEDQLLAVIVDDHSVVVEAYFEESGVQRLRLGAEGMFYPSDLLLKPVPVTVVEIETTSTRELPDQYLASTVGGEIAVREVGEGRLVPEASLYRIRLSTIEGQRPDQVVTGSVEVQATRESIALRVGRLVWSLLLRESGF